jgi:hypothetical protein
MLVVLRGKTLTEYVVALHFRSAESKRLVQAKLTGTCAYMLHSGRY